MNNFREVKFTNKMSGKYKMLHDNFCRKCVHEQDGRKCQLLSVRLAADAEVLRARRFLDHLCVVMHGKISKSEVDCDACKMFIEVERPCEN